MVTAVTWASTSPRMTVLPPTSRLVASPARTWAVGPAPHPAVLYHHRLPLGQRPDAGSSTAALRSTICPSSSARSLRLLR